MAEGNSRIGLAIMTRELCRQMYKEWENDEAICMDMERFHPFQYHEEKVDCYFDSKQQPDRVFLAILLDQEPIGEIHLKQMDFEKKECTLSIHLKNDSVKGRGYGTDAERLAVAYAFDTLGMNTVFADTVLKNKRSQHVLEKVGFRFIKEEGFFRYYRIDRAYDDTEPPADLPS